MGRQSSKKKRGTQRRVDFRPDMIGYIEGLRLAAWTIEKTYGMVEMYRSENGISSPTTYSGPPIPHGTIRRLSGSTTKEIRHPDTLT